MDVRPGAGALVLQLGYTATTARVLPPSVFGPFAASQAMVLLMGYLSLAAVAAAIARRVTLTRVQVGSAWSLAFLGGTAAAVATVGASSMWAKYGTLRSDIMVMISRPSRSARPTAAISTDLLAADTVSSGRDHRAEETVTGFGSPGPDRTHRTPDALVRAA